MRRLSLLLAGAALWLFLFAIPALADGGPHIALTNSGSSVLTADSCAGCHRAHTASGEYLIKAASMEALCLSCHGAGGTDATTDVWTGVQYASKAEHGVALGAGVKLGALRAGGFNQARLGPPTRISYTGSRGTSLDGQVTVQLDTPETVTSAHLVLTGGPSLGNQHIAWGNGANGSGDGPEVELECTSCHNPHGNGQYRILNPLPSASSSTDPNNVTVDPVVYAIKSFDAVSDTIVTTVGHPYQVGDLVVLNGANLPTCTTAAPCSVVEVPDGIHFRVGTITTAAGITVANITTSGTGGTVQRAKAVVTDSDPGTLDSNGVATRTKNYTVIQKQGTQGTPATYLLYADQVSGIYNPAGGDYFHRTVPWNQSGTNATTTTADDAPNGIPATITAAGDSRAGQVAFNVQITAWCSSCHSRYMSNGNPNPGITTPLGGSSPATARGVFSADAATRVITSTASHGFVVGDQVTFSGSSLVADGTYTIETVPSSFTFTLATAGPTPYTPGAGSTPLAISATNTGGNVTVTGHGLSAGNRIAIVGSNTISNGVYFVYATPDANTITIGTKQDLSGSTTKPSFNGGAFGTVTLMSDVAISAVSALSDTFTTASAHGFALDDRVVIAGVAPSAFNGNGTFYIDSVPDATHFTVKSSLTGSTFDISTNATASTGFVSASGIRTSQPQAASSWWFPRTTGVVSSGSLVEDDPFAFQHRTIPNRACTTCHVAHGSNAQMSGPYSQEVPFPNGVVLATDSRLLKVDNRGTCQVCHDPSGTFPTNSFNSPFAAVAIASSDATANTITTGASNGLAVGDYVYISGHTLANTSLNTGKYFYVSSIVSATTFQIVDSSTVPTLTAPGTPLDITGTGGATGTVQKIGDVR